MSKIIALLTGTRIAQLTFIFLLGIFSVFVFYKIGDTALRDFDEAIYAQVAQEAFQGGDQLGFTWNGNIGLYRPGGWFEKPPLMIWLIQLSYSLFGINEFSARLWTAIFAVLTVALAGLFAKQLTNSWRAAVITSGLFLTAFHFIDHASILQFDIPVGFFILLSLYSFWKAKSNSKFFYLFWIAVGLGVMTKSVIGLLPLLITGTYFILARQWAILKSKELYLGSLLFLLIAVPWHIIEHIRFGKEFWNQYLFYHLLKRFSTGLESNGNDFWFYWKILFAHKVFFWSYLAAFAYSLFKVWRNKEYLYLVLASLIIFLFFGTAKTKLSAYILVIYPYLAITTSLALCQLIKKIDWLGKYLNPAKYISGAIVVFLLIVFVFFGYRYNQYKLLKNRQDYYADSKQIGNFLKDNYQNLPVFYYSQVGTKPSLIFYSNRVINFLPYPSPKPTDNFLLTSEIPPDYENYKTLLKTSTQSVHLFE